MAVQGQTFLIRRIINGGDPRGVNLRLHGRRSRHRLLLMSSAQYQTLRSVSDNHVFVICGADEAFADLPDHVRHQGPLEGDEPW